VQNDPEINDYYEKKSHQNEQSSLNLNHCTQNKIPRHMVLEIQVLVWPCGTGTKMWQIKFVNGIPTLPSS
jgi:hypothetical protein